MAPLNSSIIENGYWGAPTSTLDWCETNYEVSYFIAEFWNTVSNISMIILPLYGIMECHRHGLERIFTLNYFLLLFTGIGSWMFHMTLMYEMQLLDELPMVWGASCMLYTLYKTDLPLKSEGNKVGLAIFFYATALTVSYLVIQDPVYYQILYGLLISANIILGVKKNYHICGETTGIIFFSGLLIYLLGFALWNVDTLFCSAITSSRKSRLLKHGVLSILSPFTQLHGWWHILAGFAGYLQILLCIQHRLKFLKIKSSLQPSVFGWTIAVESKYKVK